MLILRNEEPVFFVFFSFSGSMAQMLVSYMNIAKDRKVIPDPIDDRKFQE